MIHYQTINDLTRRNTAVARWLGDQLAAAGGGRTQALGLMVSGGRSPAAVLEMLATDSRLDWGNITLFASDERCVATDHPDSTEGMVRGAFDGAGIKPNYQGIGPDTDPDKALIHWRKALQDLPPIAAGLLGIGEDAHTASLFPGRPESEDERGRYFAIPETPPHKHARLTLGRARLREIASSAPIALIVAGESKHHALRAALDPQADPRALPAAILREFSQLVIFQDTPA